MALSNEDLKKIGNLVKSGYEYLDAKWDKRFTQLELRLDKHENENNKRFDVIEKKIDQLIETEHEDITAIYKDIGGIKTRLKKAGI